MYLSPQMWLHLLVRGIIRFDVLLKIVILFEMYCGKQEYFNMFVYLYYCLLNVLHLLGIF